MAFDTRAKRFAIMNFGRMPPIALFEADGSIDRDDRAHLLGLYEGVFGDGVSVEIPKSDINLTSYAPTASNNITASVEIPKHDLTITSYIPSVSADGSLSVEIPKSNLTLTSYIPSVDTTNHIEVIIPKHDLSLQAYPPSIVVSSSVNAIIPKTDINLTSYIPTVSTAAGFETASQRIYDYPAVNYTFSFPSINRVYIMKRK